jgi:beta-glucanase (GH16 family)
MSWNRRGIVSVLFCGAVVLVAGLSAVPVASTQSPAQSPTECAALKPASMSPVVPEKELHLDGVSGTFVQTFVDNFDGPALDIGPSGAWTPNFGSGRQLVDSHTLRANGELEAFVDPAFAGTGSTALGLNPFSMHGGFLTIAANKTPDDKRAALWGLPYTSGMISTVNGFGQTYGYFEMRARLPSGKGMWPAFWLLPKDGTWPPELDVMEMLGDRPTRVYLTPHSFAGGKHSFHTMQADLSDTSAAPHRFGLLWTSKDLTWFVDRRPAASYPTPADMTKPMYLVASLAVGGTWPGAPDSSTCFPATMDIDYIAAWRGP